jgi:hypothetical protein
LYTGKSTFAETNLSELLAAPLMVLITPTAVGLTIGIALRVCAYSRGTGPEVPKPFLVFRVGIFLGVAGALVIFFFAPHADYGFLIHILAGLLIGGAISSAVVRLSPKIEQSLS